MNLAVLPISMNDNRSSLNGFSSGIWAGKALQPDAVISTDVITAYDSARVESDFSNVVSKTINVTSNTAVNGPFVAAVFRKLCETHRC